MTRTTITLPEKLKARALRAARSHGLSLGELIRDSLESLLARDRNPKGDVFFADQFTFTDSGPPDVAANTDKYLAEICDENYRREQEDSFLADTFVAKGSGPRDVAANHDKYLAQVMDEKLERNGHKKRASRPRSRR